MNQYVNTEEFMDFILNYIKENKLYDHFVATDFHRDDSDDMIESYNAMLHGFIWATTLMESSEVPKYYG